MDFLRIGHKQVLDYQLSRRQVLLGGSAVAAFGLLSACGSDDDDDEPVATATSADTGATDATPTEEAAEEEPTEEAAEEAPTEGAAEEEPTEEVDDSEATEPGEEATTAPDDSGAEGEPQNGGTFAASITSSPPNFDVHQSSTFLVCVPMMPCYNMLVHFDVNNPFEYGPDLAESWEVSDDGLEVTFQLHENVMFHHGKECTAEDVKASYDRIINPPEGVVSPRQSVFATVNSVEARDTYEVAFVLSEPTASLIPNTGQGWMTIFPKDVLDEKGDMTQDVVGTGPFRFKEYVEGVSLELERNPDYFKEGLPYLDGIIFYIIADQNTDTASFISGQLDFARTTNIGDSESVREQMGDQAEIYIISTTSNQLIDMNAAREPWGDERVRRAATLSIDRTQAIEFLTDGVGEVAGIMYPGGYWALSQEELTAIPGYTLDPDVKAQEREEARALLAEAGYPDGLEAQMLVRQGDQYERTAIFLQDQLAQVGINCILDVQETTTFYEVQAARDYDVIGGSKSVAIDDPDGVFGNAWLADSGNNDSQYSDPEVEEMFIEQAQMNDADARLELVREMERLSLERALKGTLGFRVNAMMINSRVKNWRRVYSQYICEQHEETWLAE